MTKVCVVTSSRADFGLLQPLLKQIASSRLLELILVVTGSHLSEGHGYTINEIIDAGWAIDKHVDICITSDTEIAVAKSSSIAMIGHAEIFDELKPNLVVVLGDRYEILAVVSAAFLSRIPVAHIAGGEKTIGSFDDSIRHAITKLSHLHFVVSAEYRHRVLQLGENPDRVFNVGALAADVVRDMSFLQKTEIEKILGCPINSLVFLVTWHPETIEGIKSVNNLRGMLRALDNFSEVTQIFTMPNVDPGSLEIQLLIKDFVEARENAFVFDSLGSHTYVSLLALSTCIVGNSSSGITEAPLVNTPTVNVGSRQIGRLRSSTVIDVEADESQIIEGLKLAIEMKAKLRSESVKKTTYPRVSEVITRVIEETITNPDLWVKEFTDI